MSEDHKSALAEGREQGRKIRSYLEALESNKPKRGRRRTQESISKRLATIEWRLTEAEPLTRVQLVQERLDLQAELATSRDAIDLSELESGFIEAAAAYSGRKGISYAAWREVGVAAAVLKRAGILRRA